MLLSRLEISGFKSFPEKTIIDFDGGITGVVGPNGCGKSNILDSIRWVMGEQRTSVLRSSRMEQMIFSGTSSLKPIGMAEVTLIIKNNRGLLPLEYEDISITRRLYRSGESEYYLNKRSCRLKDIVELFFDTGMGTHAYSVIQQGMIDSILSDKTEDRRSLFEEAAGVTKYKYRKKEAENKLAATEADLLRLGDVIAEIEKQVVTLRRQAKRAARYSKLRETLKEVHCVLSAGELHETRNRFDELSRVKDDLRTRIESITAEVDRLQVTLEEARLSVSEVEREASEYRQKDSDLAVEAAGFENEIKIASSRIESSETKVESCRTDISALQDRIENLKQTVEENKMRLVELESEKECSARECENLENALGEILAGLSGAERDLDEKRKSHLSASERNSEIRTELSYLRDTSRNLSVKLAAIEEEARDFDAFRDDKSAGLSELEIKKAGVAGNIEQLNTNRAAKVKARDEVAKAEAESREALAALRAELSALEARRDIYEQMIETGEGYVSGAAALRSWPASPSGLLLPLAEVLEIPEKYRIAVAAALGDMAEIVPVMSIDIAYAAIEFLKSNSLGRAVFLDLDRVKGISAEASRPDGGDGFIGYLDDLVNCPVEYRPAVRLLLGRVGLFRSEDAIEKCGSEWDFYTRVTLDGLAILPSGFLSGGKTSAGVLGRQQDLQSVGQRIGILKSREKDIEAKSTGNREISESLDIEIADLEKRIAGLEAESDRLAAEFNQLRFDFKEKENRYSSAREEAARLKTETAEIGHKIEGLEVELKNMSRDPSAGVDALNESVRRVEKLRSEVKEIESKLTSARIRNVELDGLTDKLESDIRHAEELIAEASRMIDNNRQDMEKSESAIAESREKIERLKISLEKCFERKNQVRLKLNEFEGAISEAMTRIAATEKSMGEKRRERETLISEQHEHDLKFVELESSRKTILERLKVEFGVANIEQSPLPEDQSPESLSARIAKIRETLKRMEPVNLMAAEDYERENDRLVFLVRQRDDLLEAKSSLKEAIRRINTTAENRFNETFGKIRQNFQRVFTSLFEGGEAAVELEDPSDPLESPIKISARPGGKKMLTVTQLSGGERALTAISLLFGIYLVKPSPFCILDEVDAPLDDANLIKFLKLIKNFARDTQFIVITHNKLTMEASDILYGVTMQTPGVSKVVSVKFGGNGDSELRDAG